MEKIIITIGRQFGAGGREIGKELSKRLGIAYYDKELLYKAAQLSGLSEKYLEQEDEKTTKSFLYSLVMGTRTLTGQPSLEELTWYAERDAITSIADEGNCILVGRCADYVLRERKNVLKLFFMSDEEQRIKRVSKRDVISKEQAASKIQRMDRARGAYYHMYTGYEWGHSSHYDLCISTSKIEKEKIIKMIVELVENRKTI